MPPLLRETVDLQVTPAEQRCLVENIAPAISAEMTMPGDSGRGIDDKA